MKTWFQRKVLSLLYGRIPWTDHPSDSRLSRWIRRYIRNFDVTKYPELLGRPLYGLVITGEMGNVMERMSSHYFERIVAALQRFCVADQSGGAVALAVDLSEFASVKLKHKNVVVPPNLFEDPLCLRLHILALEGFAGPLPPGVSKLRHLKELWWKPCPAELPQELRPFPMEICALQSLKRLVYSFDTEPQVVLPEELWWSGIESLGVTWATKDLGQDPGELFIELSRIADWDGPNAEQVYQILKKAGRLTLAKPWTPARHMLFPQRVRHEIRMLLLVLKRCSPGFPHDLRLLLCGILSQQHHGN